MGKREETLLLLGPWLMLPFLDPRLPARWLVLLCLGHSPRFPDGFSTASTSPRLCCSSGGTPGRTPSPGLWHIGPESQPASGRWALSGPPGKRKDDWRSNSALPPAPLSSIILTFSLKELWGEILMQVKLCTINLWPQEVIFKGWMIFQHHANIC